MVPEHQLSIQTSVSVDVCQPMIPLLAVDDVLEVAF